MKNYFYVINMADLGDGEFKPFAYDDFYTSKEEAMKAVEENENLMVGVKVEWHNDGLNVVGESIYEDGSVVGRYLVGCWKITS